MTAAAPASRPAVPQRIGRYTVLGLLGSGGMGVVYEGYDEQLARKVAIKRLNRRVGGEEPYGRSLREGQALARLAHPNVVAVHEVVEADGHIYIVMERVAGRTLRAWLAERRPHRRELLDALEQAGRGVAAAHAAGLVHRDFKPDNIMVGDDGRVRVMDFGLARATESDERDRERTPTMSSSANMLAAPVTVAGEQLGTPGYMAPEQYLGLAADARSDVFGFCVVLFEALYGRRPFVGHGVAELREATLRGRIGPLQADDVPAWLAVVVRRGLAVDPGARWPSMEALLEALTRDPLGRRRRIARAVALGLLAGALVVGLAGLFVRLERSRELARAEQMAATRLLAIEVAIARAVAEGDPSGADAVFRAFVSDPAHRGTRALAQAWQRRGDRQRDDPEAAQAAYAEAYVQARAPDDSEAALRGLAGVFHETWQPAPLERTLVLLRAHTGDDPALAESALDAALWQRDLAGAAALARPGHPRAAWGPALAHLAGAHRTAVVATALVELPPGRAARFAAVGGDGHEVALLDGSLAEVGRWRADGEDLRLVPGTSWVFTQTDGEAALHDLLLRGAALWRGPSSAPVYRAAALDLDGDGTPEPIFGRVSPVLGLRRLDGVGGPAARERVAHGATEERESSLEAAAIADLDGDGVAELAAAIGPWRGFDLRVFRVVDGELALAARRRIGRIGALAIVRRGDRRLIAALTDDSCPAPEMFPEPPHTGAPAGVHLFEWTGSDLAEVEFVPLARAAGLARFHAAGAAAVGDLDGDRREDVAAGLSPAAGGRVWTLLLRQTEAGFTPLYVADVRPWSAAQLDDDAAAELLVTAGPENRLYALGLGDGRLPDLRAPAATRAAAPALADPLLVTRWERADELAALGLTGRAAATLREAADLAAEPSARLALFDRAGELFAAVDDDDAVLAVAGPVRDDPVLAPRALARSARALVRLGRYDEALAAAEALVRASGRSEAEAALADQLRRELAPLVDPNARVEPRFDVPLAPAWTFGRPGAARRDPTRGALTLTLPVAREPAAELPVEWDGGPLSLVFELRLDRLEYGACVGVALVDADGEPWLGGLECGLGGGGRLLHAGRCKVGGLRWQETRQRVVGSAAHPRTVRFRIDYFPARRAAECVIDDGEGVQRQTIVGAAPPAPGRHRLAVGAFTGGMPPHLAVGDLQRLVLLGARTAAPVDVEVDRQRPALLLAENEPRTALAALADAADPHPRADLVRLLALDRLGDVVGLARATESVLVHLNDKTWRPDLALVLREHPLASAALREAAGASILPALADAWELLAPHRDDPDIRRRALDGLVGVETLEPDGPEQRLALRRLLAERGRMWARAGDGARARRDLEIAASTPLVDGDDDDRTLLIDVHVALVRLLLRDDAAAARRHAREVVRLAARDHSRERLLADPELAERLADGPDWRDVLAR